MSKLFIGNLSFNASEDALRAIFEQDGRSVGRVSIATDRETGQPRGFGFVEMGSPADAAAAIAAVDGYQLDGRALRVSEARERQPRGDGGFSPNRFGNGGRSNR